MESSSGSAILGLEAGLDEAEAGQRRVGALQRGDARVAAADRAGLQREPRPPAAQLLVELLLEATTQQVEGERVDAGVGEGQEARTHTGDVVRQGGVHLRVAVGAVQVDGMIRKPANREEPDEHQDHLSQPLA